MDQTLSSVDASILIKVLLARFTRCPPIIAEELGIKLRDIMSQIRNCDREIKKFLNDEQPRYLLQVVKYQKPNKNAIDELCHRVSINTIRYLRQVDHQTRILLLKNEAEVLAVLRGLEQMYQATKFVPIIDPDKMPAFSYFAGVYRF